MIAVNCSHRLAPFADAVFAMDAAFWDAYADEIGEGIERWTSHRAAAQARGLNFIDSEPGGGLSARPETIRQGGNSGFQAVSLAIHFGAARVVLLGFDMQMTGGQAHWHGNHGGKLGNPFPERIRFWLTRFEELARVAPLPIINATRETALGCFPREELAAALRP